MKLYKTLEIPIKEIKQNTADILLSQLSEDSVYLSWGYKKIIKNNKHTIIIEITEYEEDIRFDCVNEFIKLIKINKAIIDDYKFEESNISLSVNYEYDEQCNMEFYPDDLKRLGDNGITLCISCWKRNDLVT